MLQVRKPNVPVFNTAFCSVERRGINSQCLPCLAGGHVSRSVFNSLARTKLPSFLTNVVLQFSFICNKMVSKEGDMDDQSLCEICETKNH